MEEKTRKRVVKYPPKRGNQQVEKAVKAVFDRKRKQKDLTKQVESYVEKWTDILNLRDWRIAVYIVEKELPDATQNKQARVSFIPLDTMKRRCIFCILTNGLTSTRFGQIKMSPIWKLL